MKAISDRLTDELVAFIHEDGHDAQRKLRQVGRIREAMDRVEDVIRQRAAVDTYIASLEERLKS